LRIDGRIESQWRPNWNLEPERFTASLLPSLDETQKAKAQTELPGLAARGPGGMRHAGMPMIGGGMMMGPMGGGSR
jgi:hypothetical protein